MLFGKLNCKAFEIYKKRDKNFKFKVIGLQLKKKKPLFVY